MASLRRKFLETGLAMRHGARSVRGIRMSIQLALSIGAVSALFLYLAFNAIFLKRF